MNLSHLRQLRIRATLEGSEYLPLLETLEELCELTEVDDTDELVEAWGTSLERPKLSLVPQPSNVIPIERESAQTLYNRAGELDEDPDTYETAELLYRRAVKLNPSMADAWTNLASLLYRQGKTQDAIVAYGCALQIQPTQVEALYNMGMVMRERFDSPGQAIEWFEKALASDPNFADAHFNLASALEERGQKSEARKHWQKYLELEPKSEFADVARAALGLRRIK